MTPAGIARCQLQLVHALSPRDEAIEQAPAFGAGWEGFLDWLADVLAGRSHGADDAYDTLLPYYETLARRLGRVRAGNVADSIAGDEGCPTVRHVRAIEAPSPAVGADPLHCRYDAQGRCAQIDPCWGRPAEDECLAETEERAWSSPIFVDQVGSRRAD